MNTFVCSQCNELLDEPLRSKSVRHLCKACWNERKADFRRERAAKELRAEWAIIAKKAHGANSRPAIQMFRDAKRRAKTSSVPFTITIDDIIPLPTVCPVLGLPLQCNEGKLGDTSYSLDKVVPSQGYAPGNVNVVSYLANAMKRNATPDEILSVALYAYTATGHTLPDIHAKVNEIAQRQVEYAKINAGTETAGDYAQPDLTQPEAKPHVPAVTSDTRGATAVIPMKNIPGAIEANEFIAASSFEGSKFGATTETLGTGSSVCSVHSNPLQP